MKNNQDFEKYFYVVCDELGVDAASVNINLHFVDSEEITTVNKQYRGKDQATDVLSFPLLHLQSGDIPSVENFANDINPETGKIEMGDILICEEMAGINLTDDMCEIEDRIGFLYVHGCLHLFGYTHDNDEDYQRMLHLTKKIISKWRSNE
ncbi:MAG: rRNA maturation RNase YbeY [Firmicutes bacterium]|nr:rRNA maturation RNase YbeY [Bacillota bacterium]